jgi:hypothetical protein
MNISFFGQLFTGIQQFQQMRLINISLTEFINASSFRPGGARTRKNRKHRK